VAGAGSVTTG